MFDRYLQARTSLRREIPGLAGVYVFGSEASGQARPDSDIDLAFLANTPVPRQVVLGLIEALSAEFGRDVDLIDLRVATTVLQMQVLSEGVLIDQTDPVAIGLFEVSVMREYADLKVRRGDIEKDVVARGRVHA